ncbi:hypothetical protein [Bradyrhizobium sp.]|uniref:hypothetical protein n=1 Tax=Bradyrhizobium sp. TaxID=376 RepID=UPI003D1509B3
MGDNKQAVVARLDRAIQYSRERSFGFGARNNRRGVLDAPVKPGHDDVIVARLDPPPA